MKKKVLILVSVGLAAVLVIIALIMGLVVGPNMEREALLEKYPDRGVARINIDLNGVSLDDIKGGSKEEKYEGNKVTIIGEGEQQDEESVQAGSNEKNRQQKNKQVVGEGGDVWEFSDVQVKGRGNGTWGQEKKPYQIKFKNKVDMFGLGKARKWVLLANAMDATNLRTDAAFYLERMLGMEYSFDGEFVELYFDGEYEGLYYLTHAVEIGKSSVDLKDSMGVLVELDNIYGMVKEHYKTGNGDTLGLKSIVKKDNIDVAMGDFLDSYDEFEKAVSEGDYEKISKLVDVESFAKYYLLSEFIVNPDAYWTSFYMYKDGKNDKIHAGPGWDFDLAFSNKAWANWMGEDFYSPTKTMVRKSELLPREVYEEMGLTDVDGKNWHEWSLMLSRIMFNLMKVPEFQKEVSQVYSDRMQGQKSDLLQRIEWKMNEIKEAAITNEQKWGDKEFLNNINAMREWISERYDYFDETYGGEDRMIY